MAEEYIVSDVRYDGGADRGIISWTTDEPSDSQVELGTSRKSMTPTELDPELVTYHSVVLTGLEPDTRYFYRVKSKNAAGKLSVSEGSFHNPWITP
jgi:phosphodiesterase/alkaline phosphatase D-like protein